MKTFSVCVLIAVIILLLTDTALVLFAGGVNVRWGWLKVRSATIEFPVIALLCAGLLLLAIRGQYKEMGLLVFALAMTLPVTEGILRIIDHPLSRPYVDYSYWYEPSDTFGHRLAPGFEGFGPLNVPVRINSHGFRGEEHSWDRPEGTVRILGLGDSFLFGWGIPESDAFLKQLEGLLGRATQKPIETINTGVPGWGLNQYYIYLKNTGVRYSPDIVVLAYFADDLNDAIKESIPANEAYRGGLKYKGGVLHRLRLYNFIKSLSDRVRDTNRMTRMEHLHDIEVRRAEWTKRENYLLAEGARSNTDKYERLVADYLAIFKRIATEHHAALVVMYIPDIAQLYHPEVQHINRLLKEQTMAQGIPFVDMTPIFERASDYGAFYLHPRDAHTNTDGHKEMAVALADLICRSVSKTVLDCGALAN